jgi:hypothetical protein
LRAKARALLPASAAALVVAAPWVFLWRRALVGRVLFFEDVAAYFLPLWTAAARRMRSGRLPSWELGAFSGQPLLGDPQIGIFYPPHWIWLAVAPARAYTISVIAHDLWAATGAYVLCRGLGRSRPASAAAAIAFSLSAFFVLEARHEMFLVSASWIPWLLFGVASYTRAPSPRALAGIAATMAAALLGGGWSMLVFAAPVIVVFAAARAGSAPRRLASVATALALGAGLAAVQLLPALAHARLSPRALPLAESFAGSYAWPSLRYAVTLIFPTFYGDDARGDYHGAPDQWELAGYSAGALVALCALASFLTRRSRREKIAYAILVGLAMCAALGPHGPLWRIFVALPIVGRTRCPARALFAYTLLAPLLCAVGIDRLRALAPRPLRRLAWLVPGLIAIELLVDFRAENPMVPAADARIDAQVVSRIPRAQGLEGRTLIDVHLGQRFHNAGLSWDLETPGGYSSLPLWRYLHFLWIANHGRTYGGALAHDLTAQGLWTYHSPLVDLLNVRWAIVPHDRPLDALGWRRTSVGDDGIDLWANDEALPRAFFVSSAVRVDDEGAAARAIAAPDFDPSRKVIVEDPVPSGATMAPVTAESTDATHFRVRAPSDGVLVISQPHEPSWTAAIDGRDAPLLRVDYALTGVPLTAGAHEIALSRRDVPLRVGAAVSALALLATVALAAL